MKRGAFLTSLLLVAGPPLAAQSHRVNFATPVWTSPVEFSYATSIRELSDGRLIVTDAEERVIHLLSSTGALVHDIGRTGGGPKEFASPRGALALPGDSTLIQDPDQQRFLLIGPDGEPVGTVSWPSFGTHGLNDRVLTDGQGNLYFVRSAFSIGGQGTALLRWQFRAATADSIAVVQTQGAVQYMATDGGQQVRVTRAIPGVRGEGWVVGQGGQLAIVDPDRYAVRWRDADGATRQGAPITVTRVALTAAEQSSMRDGISGSTLSMMHLPTMKPAIDPFGILMAPNGEIWARRSAGAGAKKSLWDIIDGNGKLAASIELTSDRRVIGFGKRNVYLIHSDEDGIEHLEAYR